MPWSERKRHRISLRRIVARVALHIILVIGAMISAFPFYWMANTSLKPSFEVFKYPPSVIPTRLTLDAYAYVWNTVNIPRVVLNSSTVAVAQVTLNVFLSSLVAYALSNLTFPGKRYILAVVLGLLILPQQILMIPLFLQIHRLGLIDTYAGVVLPGAVSPFSIFLLRQAFLSVLVDDYVDAALVDGATHFHILFKIAYPMAKPLILTTALINFYWTWNDFLWPLLVISSDEMCTLPLALARYRGRDTEQWNAIMALATLAALPIVLLYLMIQRTFVDALVLSGLKG